MKRCPQVFHRGVAGFTIIDLLVAVGVTVVLAGLMISVALNTLGFWNRSSGKLSANATARLVLDQLSHDLAGAILRRDGNVWLAATVQRDPTSATGDAATTDANWSSSAKPAGTAAAGSLLVDDPRVEELRFGKVGVWLRFFIAQPDRNDGDLQNASAPRAVSYQIIRRNLGTAAAPQFIYTLYRSEARPFHNNPGVSRDRSTFGMGFDLYSTAVNGYNHSSTLNEKDASNIRNPNVAQLIGNHVIDFGVRFYERDATGLLVEVFPVNRRDAQAPPTTAPFTLAATSDPTRTLPATNAPTGPQTFAFPVEADVFVRVLTPEGAQIIQAFEEDPTRFAGQTWWDLAARHSTVYSRRVEIRARPL